MARTSILRSKILAQGGIHFLRAGEMDWGPRWASALRGGLAVAHVGNDGNISQFLTARAPAAPRSLSAPLKRIGRQIRSPLRRNTPKEPYFKKFPGHISPYGQIFNLLIVLQLFPVFNLYCPQFFQYSQKYYR